jgi:hypothetical protein
MDNSYVTFLYPVWKQQDDKYKFTLRNFITVVNYLHCPLEHMYCSFHAVETNNKTLDQGLWNLYADLLHKFHTAGL